MRNGPENGSDDRRLELRVPPQTVRGCGHQGCDRIIDAWQLMTPKPLHIQRLVPEGGLCAHLADHQELHIEMKGASAIAEDLVSREQQRVGIYRQAVEPAFLGRLAQRRRL